MKPNASPISYDLTDDWPVIIAPLSRSEQGGCVQQGEVARRRSRQARPPSRPPSSNMAHSDRVGMDATGSVGVTVAVAEAGPVPALLVAVTEQA